MALVHSAGKKRRNTGGILSIFDDYPADTLTWLMMIVPQIRWLGYTCVNSVAEKWIGANI
jgi:hypothetical protein